MTKQEPRGGAKGLRGQVVIVSSAAARRGVPYLGPYSATKAAQLSLAEALRVELKPHRIAVTSVHPVMTKTEFGTAAEAASNIKLPRDGTGASTSLDYVVSKMIGAIEHPRPEVWTHQATRLSLTLATLFPRVADRVLGRYRRQVEELNRESAR
jgi:short-subunit dehydrogenase